MPELYDISEWNQQPWYSTGGTRDKKYVQSPEGKYYYFKKSFKKEDRGYFFEFWSEIVASEVGTLLGFNMLKYDLAIDQKEMGCISESMISSDNEELVEGVKYLQAMDNTFNPAINSTRNLYSFQLIEKALIEFGVRTQIGQIVEIIVFDAIIGNGDRHQENWAFTSSTNQFEESPKAKKQVLQIKYDADQKKMNIDSKAVSYLKKINKFTPIYDSGSSLGREHSEEIVARMLANDNEIGNYIRRGKSEIHWQQKKLTHFHLVNELLKTSYSETTLKIIKRISNNYDAEIIQDIIERVDILVPENMLIYRLPKDRKRLMFKLIDLRIESLKRLIDNE